MNLKTWMMLSVCSGTLIACGDYVLPERGQINQSDLAVEQPHPDAITALNDLTNLIDLENERRRRELIDFINQDQAAFAIIGRVEEAPEQAAGAELPFFGEILRGVDASIEVPPQSLDAINAAARAVTAARVNTELAAARAAAADAENLAQLNEANRRRQEELTRRFADSLPVVTPGTESPPNAIPGQCYAQVQQPARYETVTEQVLDQPATKRVEVIPATYRIQKRPVVIEEAYTRVVFVPATFETVVEEVVVEPARQVTVSVPATYRTVTEEVPVRPAYRAWEACNQVLPVGTAFKGGSVLGNRVSAAGQPECLVQYPASFETVSREELVTAETTRVETREAVTQTRVVRKVLEPGRTHEVVVPAVIEMVDTQVVVTPERVQETPVPPTFRAVQRDEEIQPARQVWAPVICEVDESPELITRIQMSLAERGLYKGRIDGVNGAGTMEALNQFQLDQLDLDTPAITVDGARRLNAIR